MDRNDFLGRLIAIFLAVCLLSVTFSEDVDARSPKFPTITTRDLNAKSATFPAELPGPNTVVLIAFHREQQSVLDVWIRKLRLKQPGSPAWIEMPVVPDYGSLWRTFVNKGMRSGIVTTEARSRVFTVFGSRDKFRATLNLPTSDQVYVLLVRRDGTIVARADGRYTSSKARKLLKVLKLSR